MIKIISQSSNQLYKHIFKPIVFKINPETVHDSTLNISAISGHIGPIKYLLNKTWAYDNKSLEQTVDGLKYINPIGLAAGWDKDARTISLMPAIGFGFCEVGSITKHAYSGNPGTRLWRLKKSQSILVYYGLKNEGVDIIAPRIKNTHSKILVGTNIARTNSPDCANDSVSVEDYTYSFKKLANIGDYFTVNISCPNTYGGQPFHDKKRLDMLLTSLDKIPTKKPVYIKISPDISKQERQDIAKLSFQHNVQGFICGNLTKNRKLASIKDNDIPAVGGMSGKIVENLSNELISDMYSLTAGKKTIIGLGGVFTADDAYEKIKRGASLVQLITGLIFQGPQIIGQINQGLAELLEKDGYTNINQAIGKVNK